MHHNVNAFILVIQTGSCKCKKIDGSICFCSLLSLVILWQWLVVFFFFHRTGSISACSCSMCGSLTCTLSRNCFEADGEPPYNGATDDAPFLQICGSAILYLQSSLSLSLSLSTFLPRSKIYSDYRPMKFLDYLGWICCKFLFLKISLAFIVPLWLFHS